jgi:hypothetical protein
MSRGGARPGAGRKKLTLQGLVDCRSFKWSNQRHRKLLLEDSLPLTNHPAGEELTRIAELYRRNPHRPDGHFWAQRFEAVVKS